ncbi:hypothetical protein GCM10010988_04880 [Cnuibacter physcomitrellae]|uniref:PH domain-containing protein n=1 Tax=Cnuibacter physcomitrellae TaxID=1619308 RepID=A0A1X9LJR2_9MICO|nr:hypothetical protein [Cnuibacter physcomitrellae]ARJ05403.1 hypothetical protein B5808_09360 [Cnuibacter physcomitrellae]GGI35629.1 hypothetical protein GCM10010988_04880 [Cnuibacter physcomitrellae]
MSRLLPAALVAVLAVALLAAMVLAWRARKRRQAAFAVTTSAPQSRGAVVESASVLYVATTRAGDPLDRLTIPGLAFRARAIVTVYETGVSIQPDGERETFIAKAYLRSVGTSTWAIDRVVEPGGLVRLDWTISSTDGPADVESYLRATEDGVAPRLLRALGALAPQQEGTAS